MTEACTDSLRDAKAVQPAGLESNKGKGRGMGGNTFFLFLKRVKLMSLVASQGLVAKPSW